MLVKVRRGMTAAKSESERWLKRFSSARALRGSPRSTVSTKAAPEDGAGVEIAVGVGLKKIFLDRS